MVLVSPTVATWCLYLLTPCSRALLQKLTGSQLVKKFPAFYGTRRFITAFTRPRHLSQSWARSIQSMPPHPTSWRSTLILSSHLCLGHPSGLFPLIFSHQNPVYPSPLPHTLYMPIPSHFFSIISPALYWVSSIYIYIYKIKILVMVLIRILSCIPSTQEHKECFYVPVLNRRSLRCCLSVWC